MSMIMCRMICMRPISFAQWSHESSILNSFKASFLYGMAFCKNVKSATSVAFMALSLARGLPHAYSQSMNPESLL